MSRGRSWSRLRSCWWPGNASARARLVLVCRSGRRSMRAAELLQAKGYTNVLILQGGMLAWEAAGLLEAMERVSGRR